MKKFIMLAVLLTVLFIVPCAFAANFSPSVMKLTVPSAIHYDFTGTELSIPVNVSGAGGTGTLLIYTKEQGNTIGTVRNGHLGWHYINKIDTCLYVSGMVSLDKGSNVIKWSGKNSYGKAVASGEYTFYIFAYDNQTPKQLASQVFAMGYSYDNTIEAEDVNGKKLPNPIFYMHGNKKWIVGSDPQDSTLVETTAYDRDGVWRHGRIVLDPANHMRVITQERQKDVNELVLVKYQWVPNGKSTVITSWADNGIAKLGTVSDPYTVMTGAYSDGTTVWCSTALPFAQKGSNPSEVYVSDISDGSLIRTIDLSAWYTSAADADAGAQFHGGPDGMYLRNNRLFTQSLEGCMTLALDPYAEEDEILWTNGNGDYTHDHNFEADSAKPWVCIDFNMGPYTYGISVDQDMFNIFPAFDVGAVTFCLISGADGTGLGYHAISGETAGFKATCQFIDEDTAYDGIYTDGRDTEGGTWFVAHDSAHGMITSSLANIDENVPVAFAVAQNSPNPFNPTTTISFTIPEAGLVSVDVFNVAGQKVATVASDFMSAGSHSVTWNAAGFSAGVYFYTVRSGDFSRTMKMTLLK